MRIEVDDAELQRKLKDLQVSIPEAAAAGGGAALKELMEQLRDRVIAMIPNRGGWYDLYKRSIEVVEKGQGQYELTTTIAQIRYGDITAEDSLIFVIAADNDAAVIVARLNPWTLDMLPALKGGLSATLDVKPADESEVSSRREVLMGERDGLVSDLRAISQEVYPFDSTLPKVNGTIRADVPFLALRLEHGLGGFPRIPIWSQVIPEAEALSRSRAIIERGHGVFAERWNK